MDENYRIIYNILRTLERAMDNAEFDPILIKPDGHEISEERWKHIMAMLVDAGYVKGVIITRDSTPSLRVTLSYPEITLKGLEYLSENTMMQRMMRAAKGIKDIIPGI